MSRLPGPERRQAVVETACRVFAKGREVAQENGDLQTVREIDVFLRRLDRREVGEE